MFDNIGRMAEDLLQNFFWKILSPLLMLINTLLDSLFNGVLGLDIFSENTFISSAFACSLLLMFLIIPAKFIYELITSMIKDDEAGLDIQKKLGSTFIGILIACSLTVAVTQIVNPLVRNTTQAMLGVNIQDTSGANNVQVGDTLIETVLISFGGLPKGGEYGAKEFVRQYNAGELNVVERYEEDRGSHQKYDYVWDVSLFMSIIGVAIYVVMLFIITIQVASRMIAIGFYYLIGPLCCTSLTNYQNPQAFNVWKSTMIGQWVQTLAQIFLLALMISLLDAITNASRDYPVACLALYFGAFSLIITAPTFIQAMIGGYSAGILDSINQMRGGLGMAKGIVAGAVGGAIGRQSVTTGHLSGGIRGAVAGNVQTDGIRRGGVKGMIMGESMNMSGVTGRSGGVRGAIMGNDSLTQTPDGGVDRTRKGGIVGLAKGSTTESFNRQGQTDSVMRKPRGSSFFGTKTQTRDADSGEWTKQHNPSKVQQGVSAVRSGVSSLHNRFSNANKTRPTPTTTTSSGISGTMFKTTPNSMSSSSTPKPRTNPTAQPSFDLHKNDFNKK